MMRLRSDRVPADQLLLAIIADGIHLLRWQLFGGGTAPPRSIYSALQGANAPEAEDTVMGFACAEDFDAARRAIQGGE